MLIIFVGLIGTLTSVYGDCDFGTSTLKEFDWNKFSGPRTWFFLFHRSNAIEDDIDCPQAIFESPEGSISTLISYVYMISEQLPLIQYGNATNWNKCGYFELQHDTPLFSGPYKVLAVDYNRYFIAKHCPINSTELHFYAAFRTSSPKKALLKHVLKLMAKNNIDVSQVAMSSTDQCVPLNRRRKEFPHRDTGVGNGMQPSVSSNILKN